uniref:Uncharacterized protein n=1 Tax=Anguilla anguilla TaxID=7936 RepID=A0A0E9RVB1_ANGAN
MINKFSYIKHSATTKVSSLIQGGRLGEQG